MSKSFKTGIKYIRRNRFLTVSCVFAMSVSLFLSLVLVSSMVFSHFLLLGLEEKAQITVFFKTDTSESAILSLREDLTSRKEVEKVTYVSQEDALKIYLGQHQNDPTLLESVSSSILPASLEIKARKLASLDGLTSELRQRADVDEVVFFKDVVDTFQRWTSMLRITGLALVLIMLLVSLLVVLLSIGISVKIRADEIEIMRLVGATDFQVTSPFLWQGIIYGFISSLISFLIFAAVVAVSYPAFKFAVSSIPISRDLMPFMVFLIGVHFVFGPFFGVLSSLLGVKKYLKL